MIGPTVEEAAVTLALNSLSKPALFIARISITPNPLASETAVPDIPAKIILLTILTCARPPGSQPTSFFAKSKRRSVVPLEFINFPASKNIGTASNVNVFNPPIICWITVAYLMPPFAYIITIDVSPRLTITGIPSINITTNRTKKIIWLTDVPPLFAASHPRQC